MGKSCLGQQIQSAVVFHFMPAKHATVPMTGIFTQTHIGNIIQLREFFFSHLQRPLYDAILGIRLTGNLIFVIRDTKKHHTSHTCFRQTFQFIWQTIQRVAELSRHGRNLIFSSDAFLYKHRINQGRLVHPGLPYHLSDCLSSAESSRSLYHIHDCSSSFLLSLSILAWFFSLYPFNFITSSTRLSIDASFATAVFIPYRNASSCVCFPIQAARTFV